jgi:hypothetical protein
MNAGNPLIGLLVLYGAAQMFGWQVAVLVGVPILLEGLSRRVARMVRGRVSRRPSFQQLPPLEQGLRRGSQGFAVMVFALAAGAALVWFFGWPEFRR